MSNQLEKIKHLIEKRETARLGGGEKAIEKQHQEGQSYNSIQEYIENWKNVSSRILNAYTDWEIAKI